MVLLTEHTGRHPWFTAVDLSTVQSIPRDHTRQRRSRLLALRGLVKAECVLAVDAGWGPMSRQVSYLVSCGLVNVAHYQLSPARLNHRVGILRGPTNNFTPLYQFTPAPINPLKSFYVFGGLSVFVSSYGLLLLECFLNFPPGLSDKAFAHQTKAPESLSSAKFKTLLSAQSMSGLFLKTAFWHDLFLLSSDETNAPQFKSAGSPGAPLILVLCE